MPYQTTWLPRGVQWTFSGHVDAAEIESANSAFYNDARSETALFQIIDTLAVTSLDWDEHAITSAAAFDIGASLSIGPLGIAYIARDHDVIRKMERYIETFLPFNRDWHFARFDSLAEAQEWTATLVPSFPRQPPIRPDAAQES